VSHVLFEWPQRLEQLFAPLADNIEKIGPFKIMKMKLCTGKSSNSSKENAKTQKCHFDMPATESHFA